MTIKINRYTVNEIQKIVIELKDGKTIELSPNRMIEKDDIPGLDNSIFTRIWEFQRSLDLLKQVDSLNIYLDFNE